MLRPKNACAFGLLLLTAACGGDDDDGVGGGAGAPNAPEGRTKDGITIKPDVRVLDEAALATVAEWAPETGRLSLSAATPLAVGNVVVGGIGPKTPAGLLRRVTSLAVQGGVQSAETTQASLADVVESGRIDVKVGLTRDALPGVMARVPGVTPQGAGPATAGEREGAGPATAGGREGAGLAARALGAPATAGEQFVLGLSDVVLADADDDPDTKDDQVRLTGSVSVEPTLAFVFDASLSGVNEVSASLGLRTALTYSLRGKYGAKYDEPMTIATYPFAPILVYAGPVPLVFVPTLDVVLRPSGDLQVALAAEGTAVAQGRAGVGYKNGSFGPIHEGTATLEKASTAVAGTLTAKIEAGPDFGVKLYGIAGPYASLHGYAKLVGDSAASPCYRVTVGVEARAGLDLDAISILGLGLSDYETPPYGPEFPVGEGACDPTSEGLNPEGKNFAFSLDDANTVESRAVLPLPDGSFVVGLQGVDRVYLTRVRPDGTPAWGAALDGVFSVAGLVLAGDGRILVGGARAGAPWVAKVDLDGNLLWSNVYAPSVYNARSFARTPGGKAVLAGSTGAGAGFEEYALAVDDEGAPLWGARYDGGDEAREVRPAEGGFVMAAYSIQQGGGGRAGHVMRLDEEGNVVWNRRLGGAVSYLESADALEGGGFVATGYGLDGLAVVRLAAAGEVAASHVLYDRGDRYLEFAGARVRGAPGGGFFLGGRRGFGGGADGLLASVGGDDVVRFAAGFGGPLNEEIYHLLPVPGGVFALGDTRSLGDEERVAFGLRATAAGLGEFAGLARAALTLSYDPTGTTYNEGLPNEGHIDELESDAPAVTRTPIVFSVDADEFEPAQGQTIASWTKR